MNTNEAEPVSILSAAHRVFFHELPGELAPPTTVMPDDIHERRMAIARQQSEIGAVRHAHLGGAALGPQALHQRIILGPQPLDY